MDSRNPRDLSPTRNTTPIFHASPNLTIPMAPSAHGFSHELDIATSVASDSEVSMLAYQHLMCFMPALRGKTQAPVTLHVLSR